MQEIPEEKHAGGAACHAQAAAHERHRVGVAAGCAAQARRLRDLPGRANFYLDAAIPNIFLSMLTLGCSPSVVMTWAAHEA